MGRRARIAATVCAMSLALSQFAGAPSAVVGASQPSLPEPWAIPVSAEEALLMDAENYAARFGTSQNEAMRRLQLPERLADNMRPALLAAGERLAGAWIEHEPEFRLVISLVGHDALPGLPELVAVPMSDIDVVVGARSSLKELRIGQMAINEPLMQVSDGASYVHVQTNSVVVRSSVELLDEVRDSIERAAGVDVRFEVGPPFVHQHTRGGRSLTGASTGCTTGFTVLTQSQIPGVITAAHCPPEVDWYIFNGNQSEQYELAVYYEYNDADEDWQYMKQRTETHPVEPMFYNGIQYVTVTNGQPPPDSQMIGQTVCHFGRGSALFGNQGGRSCGEIETAWLDPGNICGPNRNSDCLPAWIAVVPNGGSYPLECWIGDSGGPWFKGSRAYGIHKLGSQGDNDECWAAVFMSLWYVEHRPFEVMEG